MSTFILAPIATSATKQLFIIPTSIEIAAKQAEAQANLFNELMAERRQLKIKLAQAQAQIQELQSVKVTK